MRIFAFQNAAVTLCLTGCRAAGHRSPTVDVMGSYFPAWLICIVCGLALAVVARLLLIGAKLDTLLCFPAVVYPCLAAIFTFLLWLTFFQN